jgi:hypothetical protein
MDLADHMKLVVAPHAQRFIDGHFGNDAPRPQISMPANENEDSDLILSRGIKVAAAQLQDMYAICWSLANYGEDIDADLKGRAAKAVLAYNNWEASGD